MSKTNEAAISAAVTNAEKKLSGKSEKKQQRQDAANKSDIAKKITDRKDLMYIYPEEINTLALRKKFRTAARRKVESYLKQVKAVKNGKGPEGVKLQDVIKEANGYFKSIHTNPELITQ